MISKPNGISIVHKVIDASVDNVIAWKTSNGKQISHEIFVYSNASPYNLIYTNKVNAQESRLVLPKDVLRNGLEYRLKIKVEDSFNTSTISDFVVFRTSSKPDVSILSSNTYDPMNTFKGDYTHKEKIPMKKYIFKLYDRQLRLIESSPELTAYPIEYKFKRQLVSNGMYFVTLFVEAVNGISNETEKFPFMVSHNADTPIDFNLQATNANFGGVELTWYGNQIYGRPSGKVYYVNGKMLDVIDGSVKFARGYKLSGGWSVRLDIENIRISSKENPIPLCTLSDEHGKLYLYFIEDRFVLKKDLGIMQLRYTSPTLPENAYTFKVVILQKDGNISLLADEIK